MVESTLHVCQSTVNLRSPHSSRRAPRDPRPYCSTHSMQYRFIERVADEDPSPRWQHAASAHKLSQYHSEGGGGLLVGSECKLLRLRCPGRPTRSRAGHGYLIHTSPPSSHPSCPHFLGTCPWFKGTSYLSSRRLFWSPCGFD